MKNFTFLLLSFLIGGYVFAESSPEGFLKNKPNTISEKTDLAPSHSPLNNTVCDPSEQCNYTFILTDTFGDGWNGNSMMVVQNGTTIATLELVSNDLAEVEVPICDGVDFELYWNAGGSHSEEVGVEIKDPSGNTIYTLEPGTENPDTSLYTATGDCPEPPLNDDLADAFGLELDTGCTGDVFSTVLATAQPDEPSGSCFDPADEVDNSVWFTFVAPENGAVKITTDIAPADFDSQIAVYGAPTNVNDLSTLGEEVGCNQDAENADNGASTLLLTGLTADDTYYIQVDGKQQNQGDFCLTVKSIACPDPGDLSVSNVQGNSAQVDWTANGIETEWKVEYGPAGFELGTGTVIFDDDGVPGTLLTNLSLDTDYEVYVSAVCSDDDSSAVIGPVGFTTPPCPEDIEVINDEGVCGAIVNFNPPQPKSGGNTDNLIQNPSAEDGLNGWVIDLNGGSGWTTGNDGFKTSYSTCSMYQVVDLVAAGFTESQLDGAPDINISEDYVGHGPDYEDTYFLDVQLRDANDNIIDEFSTGDITTSEELQTVTHSFSGYGPGVRTVYFSHGGRDTEFFAGNYGAVISNASVKVDLPEINVTQTEGMASGDEFPIGTTTNTYEITQGDAEPATCSFDVTVIDVEGPVAIANDVTLEMNQDLSVDLTPEEIDGGSTDNCGISTMSLDIVSLDCDDLGETDVTLTVTDESGNSSLATATVTLTDPNQYCELGVGANHGFSLEVYPNPTSDRITIKTDSPTIEKVEFYDLNGRLVKRFSQITGQVFTGNIAQFGNGVYLVKVYSAQKSVVKQVIKK